MSIALCLGKEIKTHVASIGNYNYLAALQVVVASAVTVPATHFILQCHRTMPKNFIGNAGLKKKKNCCVNGHCIPIARLNKTIRLSC